MNQLFPIPILLAFVVLLLQAPIFSFADSVPPQLREVIETSPQALALKALHASLSFDLGSSNDFSPVEDFSDCSRSELKTNNLVALNFLANRYAAPHTFEVQLSLNPFLLQFFENSQMIKSSACRHKNIENFLKAAVIYQLARAYDQIRFHPGLEQKEIARCLEQDLEPYEKDHCQYWKQYSGLVSDRTPYLRLSHFYRSPWGFRNGQVTELNNVRKNEKEPLHKEMRKFTYWDERELVSPAESFAVNMEYFLLDPEFACRRPAVSSYFRQLFGVEDQPQCEPRLMFYTIVEQPGKWMKVDWKKVYGVFLAVADPGGESLLGRWGHASLLIVQCAPHREVVSEECWNDQEHHVFLDYHSNPLGYEFQKDMSISDGLFGRHLAQLHPFTYANRVQYYLEREKRGLTFFELRSEVKSHAEMVRDILYFMFESFLAYRGTWNHLNKNCVTHLHESLQSSLPELQAVTLMPLTTPLELAKRYQEAGVAVPTVRLEPDL